MPQEVIDAMPSDMFLDGELWYIISILLNIFFFYFI